jgi:hypothetical protein
MSDPATPQRDANPYAAPRTTTVTIGRAPFIVTVMGLCWYAFGGLVSVPFAVLATRRADVVVTLHADRTYNYLAGLFYGFRGIADLGLYVAFVAGLVWLYQAWRRTQTKKSKRRTSAAAVVGWTLVPVWGYWRLYGFLIELSRRTGLDEEVVKVGRWWLVLAAHVIVRVVGVRIILPGWFHVGDWVLQAAACGLGIQMLSRFQRALTRERELAGSIA